MHSSDSFMCLVVSFLMFFSNVKIISIYLLIYVFNLLFELTFKRDNALRRGPDHPVEVFIICDDQLTVHYMEKV